MEKDFTTFDEKLDQLLEKKRLLAQDMLNGAGDVNPGEFNLGEVAPPANALNIDEIVSLDMALKMDWRYFECLIGVLWSKQGYACYYTPTTKDNGVDVVAILGETGHLIQVKTSSVDGIALGWDAVKEVVTGEAFYQRQHPKVKFQKICFTNQFFNQQAQENAALNRVQLFNQMGLEELLKQHHVTLSEIEKSVYPEWTSQQ
jgi:Holliday junction resolvase